MVVSFYGVLVELMSVSVLRAAHLVVVLHFRLQVDGEWAQRITSRRSSRSRSQMSLSVLVGANTGRRRPYIFSSNSTFRFVFVGSAQRDTMRTYGIARKCLGPTFRSPSYCSRTQSNQANSPRTQPASYGVIRRCEVWWGSGRSGI